MSAQQAHRCVKVVVLPVFRRDWLYHAVPDSISIKPNSDNTKAETFSDKLRGVGKQINHKLNSTVMKQWSALQSAEEGTFKNTLYKLAKRVLEKEHPVESFLKRVPRDAGHVEVTYPESLGEKRVRRRLRLIATKGAVAHQRRMIGWALITVPQIPLLLTPVPNVTIYYSVYKLVSNIQAFRGATILKEAFHSRDAALQAQGGSSSSSSSSAGLPEAAASPAADSTSCSGTAQQQAQAAPTPSAAAAGGGGGAKPAPPSITFLGSSALEAAVQPVERWHTPLPDTIADQLRALHINVDGLLDHLGRVRRRALALAPAKAAADAQQQQQQQQ